MRLILPVLLLLLLCLNPLPAQDRETAPEPKPAFLPKPGKAVLYGLIPGGGQVYNRRYWKVPLVYGAMGGLFLLSQQNRAQYLDYKSAYEKALRGEPHAYSSLNLPNSVLRNARDVSRKSMEEAYIFLTLAYVVQLAEAYVDAHLQDFNVSDDLSLRLRPSATPTPGGFAPGLAIQVPLQKQKHATTYP